MEKLLKNCFCLGAPMEHWLNPATTLKDVADYVTSCCEQGENLVISGEKNSTAIDGETMVQKFFVPFAWDGNSVEIVKRIYGIMDAYVTKKAGVEYSYGVEKNRIYITKA